MSIVSHTADIVSLFNALVAGFIIGHWFGRWIERQKRKDIEDLEERVAASFRKLRDLCPRLRAAATPPLADGGDKSPASAKDGKDGCDVSEGSHAPYSTKTAPAAATPGPVRHSRGSGDGGTPLKTRVEGLQIAPGGADGQVDPQGADALKSQI